MDCIDLKQRFGKRYRIVSEDGSPHNVDPWNWTIPCRYGHFYPHGGTRIGFATNSRGRLGAGMAKLPFVKVEQEADDGYNLSFDVTEFAKIAQLVKPRIKRHLSEKQKAILAEASRPFRFVPGSK